MFYLEHQARDRLELDAVTLLFKRNLGTYWCLRFWKFFVPRRCRKCWALHPWYCPTLSHYERSKWIASRTYQLVLAFPSLFSDALSSRRRTIRSLSKRKAFFQVSRISAQSLHSRVHPGNRKHWHPKVRCRLSRIWRRRIDGRVLLNGGCLSQTAGWTSDWEECSYRC